MSSKPRSNIAEMSAIGHKAEMNVGQNPAPGMPVSGGIYFLDSCQFSVTRGYPQFLALEE